MWTENLCEADLSVTDNWQISEDLPVAFVSVSKIQKL